MLYDVIFREMASHGAFTVTACTPDALEWIINASLAIDNLSVTLIPKENPKFLNIGLKIFRRGSNL